MEKRILDYSLQFPTQGPQRVANQLRLENVNVSAGGVRGVWLRHEIETRHRRLLWLERKAREQTGLAAAGPHVADPPADVVAVDA